MITAPYNFVPLSDKVVMPFWTKHVSHDIPFENAHSGTLKVKITAKSPIFVRNGMPRTTNEDDPRRNEFNNIDGRYFIPGSSLKGMIRSVVEIMSYGRMKNKINDHKYSVRDFQNNDIYPKTDLSNKIECGWLYKEGEIYYLDECGKPGRISHKELDGLCDGNKISNHYKNAKNVSNDRQKSAKSKYDLFPFDKTGHKFSKDRDDMGRPLYKIGSEDGQIGTIVMSGQASVRKEPEESRASGKHLEFVFFEPKSIKIEVGEEVIKNFFFAYYNHDRNQQKDDWKWRKKQLDKGEKIPVFYRKDSKGEIIDMGLTQLYKITYKNSIVNLIDKQQKESDGYDLAETIFGFAEGEKALKGRVHFGHAFMDNQMQLMGIKTEVLAGPKASYYPNYVDQNANEEGRLSGNYNTYMNSSAKIRGWKRYPIRNGGVKSYDLPKRKDGTVNYDVANKFNPLPADTEFSFDITYHNLRKEELGALISAITFHNTEGLFHSIGSAKPLGYGKISLEIKNLDDKSKIEMLKAYELFMDSQLDNSTPLWFQSMQMKELISMAEPGNDEKLKYMGLIDFVKAKGRGKNDPKFSLPYYSKISGNTTNVKSLITEDELKHIIQRYEKEKTLLKSQEDISVLQKRKLENKKSELEIVIQQKKKELLDKLEEKRLSLIVEAELQKAEQETRDREARKEGEALKAQQEGFTLPDNFNFSHRDALKNLNIEVAKYSQKLHNVSSKNWREEIKEEEVLQKTDLDYLTKAIKEIINKLPKKKRGKLLDKKFEENHAFNSYRWWLGETRARKLFEELKNDS